MEKPDTKPTKRFPKFFQWSLHITNLPPTIKTSHFNYILSHPIHYSGSAHGGGRNKRDPGITIIQIYHLPPPTSEPTKLKNLGKRLKNLLCIPTHDKIDEMGCATHSNPTHRESTAIEHSQGMEANHPSPNAREGDLSRVETREVPESPREPVSGNGESDHLLMNIHKKTQREEEMEVEGRTVAWIHFKDEDHLYKAKKLLNSITIDGRKITVKSDNFNTGLIRKMW